MARANRITEDRRPVLPSPLEIDDQRALLYIAAKPRDPFEDGPPGMHYGRYSACRRKLIACGLVALDAPPAVEEGKRIKAQTVYPPAVYILTRAGEEYLRGATTYDG